MSSFWRARASASMRRASACAAFMPCDAHIVRPRAPNSTPMTAATAATATTTGVSIGFLPSGPDHAAGRITYTWARSRRRRKPCTARAVWLRTVDPKVRAPSLGRDRAVADVRYAVNDRRLGRPGSVGPGQERVNRLLAASAVPGVTRRDQGADAERRRLGDG